MIRLATCLLVGVLLLLSACGYDDGEIVEAPPPPAPPTTPTLPATAGLSVQASAAPTVQAAHVVSLAAITLNAPSDVTFLAEQIGGTPVTLQHAATANPTFTAPALTVADVLTFRITATAADGTRRQTTVAVRVQPDNITVDAGSDRAVVSGDTVSLHARGQGEGPSATYAWTQVSPTAPVAALSGADTANPTFVAPAVPTTIDLVFEVRFGDGLGVATDHVTVSVSPPPPTGPTGRSLTVRHAVPVPLLTVGVQGDTAFEGTIADLFGVVAGG